MSTPELASYIKSQLQIGLNADTIAAQLRTAGWAEQDINAGFATAQQPVAPTQTTPQPAVSNDPQTQQLPPPLQQGKMKTGWQLFKQSLAIIKNNPGLSRYVAMSTALSILAFIILAVIYVLDYTNTQVLVVDAVDEAGDPTAALTIVGFIGFIIWGIVQTTIGYYYATGLSTHVLSIFRGQATTYQASIVTARQKFGAIVTYALISVIVGYIINALQRIRFVGWILSLIVGAVWTLATVFTIPLIADKKINGAAAVKESILLFKQTWGETIISRVSLGGLFFLIYFLVAIPVTIGLVIVFGLLFGYVGVIIAFALFILSIVVMSVIELLATNVLNVALYYYSTYKIIPPSFSGELLASVYTAKKKK